MKINGYEIEAGANLSEANLSEANLSEANLHGADLRWANLRWADLSGADLSEANLHGADLRWANLQGANLQGANLHGADLSGANLRWANLSGANLSEANLSEANLHGADLRWANLQGANLPHFMIVPEEGGFYAFKKLSGNVIVKIYIPAKAERTNSLIGRKCRASEIKVVSVVQGEIYSPIKSTHRGDAVYQVGAVVKADKWDGDIRIECTHGIHFFMTLKEAQEWQ